jgi:hypothetical protein
MQAASHGEPAPSAATWRDVFEKTAPVSVNELCFFAVRGILRIDKYKNNVINHNNR